MKKMLVGALALLIASPAFAASLLAPQSLAEMATAEAAALNFSGPYVGVGIGYGGGPFHYPVSYTSPGPSFTGSVDMNAAGFMGGGFAGYDHEFPSGLVLGVIGSADLSSIKSSTSIAIAGLGMATADTSVDWLLSGRGRIGYSLGRFMPYITGGVAYGPVKTSVGATGFPGYSSTSKQVGWTAGGGIDAQLNGRTFLRGEYLYTDLGTAPIYSGPAVGGDTLSAGARTRFHAVKVGIGIRF